MTKKLFFFIVFGIFTTAYSLGTKTTENSKIINTWVWEKTIGGETNPYVSTPKTIGFNKKIVFTPDGKIITYKDDVEIRNSTYEIKKGTSFFDQSEKDLISFEGKTYAIENLDSQNLTIISNDSEGTRTIYKK
ncbi:hypothetical protein [Flavobacterium pectinovorum]|uniref:hypothetical protein n=1 Tax=Flavobacterium pectinovorum TaxID=29533 RepID=UPI001FABC58D|nr:hypothetical protein [Flavobacterium pectinovorum]MCI9844102.1 hypothetical protein [Flavobacterium pectinovorum]